MKTSLGKSDGMCKPKKAKGTVLFTAICIMMIIMLILSSTIGVLAMTQRRTYAEFGETQAYYSSKSVVDSVMKYMQTDEDFAKDVYQSISKNKVVTASANVPVSMGEVVDITITPEGKDPVTEDYLLSIRATCKVGGELNSTTFHIRKNKLGSAVRPSGTSSGFVSLGGTGSVNNHTSVLGGASFSVGSDPNGTINFGNPGVAYGTIVANASVNVNTQYQFMLDEKQGLSVSKDLTLINEVQFKSFYEGADAKDDYDENGGMIDYEKIPYVYVGDKFTLQTNGFNFGANSMTSPRNPINVYCGSFDVKGGQNYFISGDVVCYDEDERSTLTLSTTTLSILDWFASIMGGPQTVRTGSFYTKGDLDINNMNKNKLAIDGDLYVQGDLYLRDVGGGIDGLTVTGTTYVGGKVYVNLNEQDKSTFQLNGKNLADSAVFPAHYEKDNVEKNIVSTNDKVRLNYYDGEEADGKFQFAYDENGKLVLKRGNSSIDAVAEAECKANILKIDQNRNVYWNDVKIQPDEETPKAMIDGVEKDIYGNQDVYTITENCTIMTQGGPDMNGTVIRFDSKDKTQWVAVDDFKTMNSLMTTTGDLDKSVNFFVNEGKTFSLWGTKLLTEYYYDKIKSGSTLDMYQYAETEEAKKYIPNIQILAESRTLDMGGNPVGQAPKIVLNGSALITGYIDAPSVELSIPSNVYAVTNTVKYNGNEVARNGNWISEKSVGSSSIAVIGSAVVGDIKSFVNDACVVFIDPTAADGDDGGEKEPYGDVTDWEASYYYFE